MELMLDGMKDRYVCRPKSRVSLFSACPDIDRDIHRPYSR